MNPLDDGHPARVSHDFFSLSFFFLFVCHHRWFATSTPSDPIFFLPLHYGLGTHGHGTRQEGFAPAPPLLSPASVLYMYSVCCLYGWYIHTHLK